MIRLRLLARKEMRGTARQAQIILDNYLHEHVGPRHMTRAQIDEYCAKHQIKWDVEVDMTLEELGLPRRKRGKK